MLLQHFDEHLNPLGARLGLFGSLYSEQLRLSILTVQRSEEGFRLSVEIQGQLKIARHCGASCRIVGVLPAAVVLCALDFLEPRGLYFTACDQRERLLTV